MIRLKSTISSDKILYEQQIHEIKTKFQLDENLRRKELEERVKTIQASKDDIINENSIMNAKLVDFQQKIASLNLCTVSSKDLALAFKSSHSMWKFFLFISFSASVSVWIIIN